MGKLFAKRKKDIVSSSESDKEYLITTSDEEEISKLESPVNIEIVFDFRNSKRLIKCIQENGEQENLENDHFVEMLKDKLILTILSHVKEVMGSDDFDEELFDKFFSFLNRRLMYRFVNSVSQFYITKSDRSTTDSDPTDFLFFECLEEIITGRKWQQYGLEGVLNEPIQCILINNMGDRSFEFESAFIMIYAKEQSHGVKNSFKFLLCKIEDGVWSFPGGKKMFPSESISDCIRREVKEELYGISLNSIESSIELGPLFSFGGSSVFVHEVEWGKTNDIIQNLIENYQSLKRDNLLFDFNSEKISKKFKSEDEEYLDDLLEFLKSFPFTEEIIGYSFVSEDEIERMKGGRSFFLKQLYNLFTKNIMKRTMKLSARSKKFKLNNY